MACHEDARAGDLVPAGSWAAAGHLRHGAGALNQSSSGRPRRRPAKLGVQVRCHGLGITESQQRGDTDEHQPNDALAGGGVSSAPI